jgi:hypothetical protein
MLENATAPASRSGRSLLWCVGCIDPAYRPVPRAWELLIIPAVKLLTLHGSRSLEVPSHLLRLPPSMSPARLEFAASHSCEDWILTDDAFFSRDLLIVISTLLHTAGL